MAGGDVTLGWLKKLSNILAGQDKWDVDITGGSISNVTLTNIDGITLDTPLAITSGGTGANTAAGARIALGLEIGADVQAHSAVLDGTTASYTTAEETKLAGIAAGATVNSSDATLLNRANHTGTQTISTISDIVLTSAASGDYLQFNGSNWVNKTTAEVKTALGIKFNKDDATAAPTINDDSGDGFEVGSRWIDITNDNIYFCVDPALGAAVWELGDLEITDLGAAAVKGFTTDLSSPSNDDVAGALAVKNYVDASTQSTISHFRETTSAGSNGGGTSATTWNARVQNATVQNNISGCSLSSGNVILPAGTYRVNANSWVFNVNGHQTRIYNVTDSSTICTGTAGYAENSASGTELSTITNMEFTLADTKTIRLEHYTQAAQATNGKGRALPAGASVDSVWSEIHIEKIG